MLRLTKKEALVLVIPGILVLGVYSVYYTVRHLSAPTIINMHPGIQKDRFRRLIFPKRDNPNIDRAVIVSLSEYSMEQIGVFADGREVMFDRTLFKVIPDGDYGQYVSNLNNEIRSWGANTDWQSVKYEFDATSSYAKLWLNDKTGTEFQYEYRADSAGQIIITGAKIIANDPKRLSN